MKLFFILLLEVSLHLGCTKQTTWEPILLSKDVCHQCKMIISDKRFGAEFLSEKGKVFKFDSLECMGDFLKNKPELKGTAFVVDSFKTNRLIELKSAQFFHDPSVRSPMGRGLFASDDLEVLKRASHDLPLQNWEALLDLIEKPELKTKL